MCGINVIISTRPVSLPQSLMAMQETTIFRGPDAANTFHHQTDNWQIALGVNRLQVIDKATSSNQPMISACGKYVLAFNGEVYNYQDLKNRLLGKGYKFNTPSDTEVILYWLQEFGADGITKMKGMYAFVFADISSKRVLIARDEKGIKPLFTYKSDSLWIISSSIRAIEESGLARLSVNQQAITDYLAYRHVMGPKSFFQEIIPQPPGKALLLDAELEQTFMDFPKVVEKDHRNLKQTLIDTVAMHFEAPETPGLLLSGGVDSTLLLAILRQEMGIRGVPTYTLATGDDQKWAARAARHYDGDHHEVPVSIRDLALVDDFLVNTDQPIADSGAFATWLVAGAAAKNGNVLLSGAGADELFGGYNRHRAYAYYLYHQQELLLGKKLVRNTRLMSLLPAPIQQLLSGVEKDPIATYNNFLQNYGIKKINNLDYLWEIADSPEENLQQALDFDLHNYLIADVLAITDNSTMQRSVETRVPYLYPDIIKQTRAIPVSEKIKQGGKAPLKELLAGYGGHKYSNRQKLGFGLPLAAWFRDKSSYWLWEFLVVDHPLFEFVAKSDVYQLLRLHQTGKQNNSMQLWAILVLAKWLSRTNT